MSGHFSIDAHPEQLRHAARVLGRTVEQLATDATAAHDAPTAFPLAVRAS